MSWRNDVCHDQIMKNAPAGAAPRARAAARAGRSSRPARSAPRAPRRRSSARRFGARACRPDAADVPLVGLVVAPVLGGGGVERGCVQRRDQRARLLPAAVPGREDEAQPALGHVRLDRRADRRALDRRARAGGEQRVAGRGEAGQHLRRTAATVGQHGVRGDASGHGRVSPDRLTANSFWYCDEPVFAGPYHKRFFMILKEAPFILRGGGAVLAARGDGAPPRARLVDDNRGVTCCRHKPRCVANSRYQSWVRWNRHSCAWGNTVTHDLRRCAVLLVEN